MRVCLVSSGLRAVPPPVLGAVEQQIACQARGLALLGVEVHVATVGDQGAAAEDARDGVRWHRLGAEVEHGAQPGAAALARGEGRFAARARALLRRLAPDIVHWHARYPCLAGLLGRRGGWRSVYHAHNWKAAERMRHPAWSARRHAALAGAAADAWIARRSDHVIAVSAFVRDAVVRGAGVAEERVSVVENALDLGRFAPGSGRSAAGQEVLFVGRLAAEKGLDVLIAAMPAVLRARPGAALEVVGPAAGGTERGAYRRRCERLVAELGLGERVRFAGAVPNAELPERLRRCRVLAVPSVWGEPCGIVVLEGLACGAPIVAARSGGIPELLEEGVTGRLCPPGDAQALAAALVAALGDERLLVTAAERGPRRAAERHSEGAVCARLLALYERLLAR